MMTDKFNDECGRVLDDLGTKKPGTKEYQETLDNLEKIHEMKMEEEKLDYEEGRKDQKLNSEEAEAKKEFRREVGKIIIQTILGVVLPVCLVARSEEKGLMMNSRATGWINKIRSK